MSVECATVFISRDKETEMTALLVASTSSINPLAFVLTIIALAIVVFVIGAIQSVIHNIIQYVRKVSGKSYEITYFVRGIK